VLSSLVGYVRQPDFSGVESAVSPSLCYNGGFKDPASHKAYDLVQIDLREGDLMLRNKGTEESNYNLEQTLGVLEHIADGFGKKSVECRAIEIAAHGLLFVQQLKVKKEFDAYMENVGKDLSPKQQAHLKKMGLI
jgi:hypothetical protein